MGLGVACASVVVPTVEAGGAPPQPVKHVTKTRYVPREKPVLRGPRWRPPRIDVIVDNDNFSRNHTPRPRHHHEEFKHDFKHEDIKKVDPVKEDKPEREYDENDEYDQTGFDFGRENWWWPGNRFNNGN
ncbi:hypothetical protein [Nonomuraea coxensis]|uniref:hypothetical protein n=1 Tax=Nonomuraea coxensis TaxID=404386 RepID=UPI0003638BE7|nr:hypothetical protein [Nonomuraea coxensis]